jgi:hypothetical protein
MDIFDKIPPGVLGMLIGLLFAIGRYFYTQKGNREADVIRNKTFQNEVKRLYNERKKINYDDIKSISENDFWEIIDGINKRSKGSYKNFLGLLKDHLLREDKNKILDIYGRFLSIITKTNNYPLLGAFNIISSSIDFKDFEIFASWLISKGQILFNNCIHNPELIRNIEIKEIIHLSIFDIMAECYETRFLEIIPEIVDFEIQEPEGEELRPEQLPDRFPQLWEKFIIIN